MSRNNALHRRVIETSPVHERWLESVNFPEDDQRTGPWWEGYKIAQAHLAAHGTLYGLTALSEELANWVKVTDKMIKAGQLTAHQSTALAEIKYQDWPRDGKGQRRKGNKLEETRALLTKFNAVGRNGMNEAELTTFDKHMEYYYNAYQQGRLSPKTAIELGLDEPP